MTKLEHISLSLPPILGHHLTPDQDWERIYVGNGIEHGSLAKLCRDIARKVVEGMREPSEAMLRAVDEFDYGYEGFDDPEKTWPAMIDAILNEERP